MFSEMREQSQDQSQNVSHVDFGCHKAYSVTAMGKALDINWGPVRSAIESGASYAKVAELFGVPEQTLRKQASRNKWISPGVVKKIVERAESRGGHSLSQDKIQAAIAETWAEKGENLRQLAYTKALNSLKTANLKPASNARDFEILDKVARRAAGLDTADNQVNLSFSVPGWGHGTKVYDVDSGAYSGPSSEEETQSPPTAIEDSGGD